MKLSSLAFLQKSPIQMPAGYTSGWNSQNEEFWNLESFFLSGMTQHKWSSFYTVTKAIRTGKKETFLEVTLQDVPEDEIIKHFKH